MNKLIITEKPSVAQAIAAVVGALARKDGYFEGNGYVVGWCLGHLAQLVSAEAYDRSSAAGASPTCPYCPRTGATECRRISENSSESCAV